MGIFKRNASTPPVAAGRRSFIRKLGAGASAAVTSAVAMGKALPAAGDADDPALRAALLEEEKVLRKLHQSFQQAMDSFAHDAALGMFTVDATVAFNGGLFRGREQGINRLFRERFMAGHSGRSMEQAPGFELAAELQQESIEVAADRRSATAVLPYSIQVGMPIHTESSLAAMARLHGEGVRTWWEGGVYRITWRRQSADARWMISRLEYDTLSRADYRSGKRYALPIEVQRFAARFPLDPHGPDELV
jgi:hypothetical protein